MLRALIFDVDGTLADTERDGHRVAFNRAFADAGLPWHWDVTRYGQLLAVAGGRERILHFIDSDAPEIPIVSRQASPAGVRAALDIRGGVANLANTASIGGGSRLATNADDGTPIRQSKPATTLAERDALARELHRRKTTHYAQLVHDGQIQLRPGIARLIGQAHAAGLMLAIATTTSRANVDALLARALPAEAGWFQVIATAEDAPNKKPDPQVYRCVLDRLDLPARQCLAVEDSAIGLRAALAAGLPTLVTANDYTRDQDFTGARAVLNDLGATRLAQLRAWHADHGTGECAFN